MRFSVLLVILLVAQAQEEQQKSNLHITQPKPKSCGNANRRSGVRIT